MRRRGVRDPQRDCGRRSHCSWNIGKAATNSKQEIRRQSVAQAEGCGDGPSRQRDRGPGRDSL